MTLIAIVFVLVLLSTFINCPLELSLLHFYMTLLENSGEPGKKHKIDFPVYWLFSKDPYNGLL